MMSDDVLITRVRDVYVSGRPYWHFTFSDGTTMQILQASSNTLYDLIDQAEHRILALRHAAHFTTNERIHNA
jgi:hypothetical protein